MRRSRAALVVVALLLAGSAGCSDDADQATTAKPSTASPSPSSTSAAASSSSSALPPAVQGLAQCPGPRDKPFTLRRGDDRITGFARSRSTHVAVLTHQFRGTPCDLAGLGQALAARGYRVVAWTTDTSPTPRTLRTLVAHERSGGARRVVLVGASAGGATSIVGAGRIDPPVDALVALSPADYSMTQGDVDRAVRRYSGPLMAVVGELDRSFAALPPRLADEHDGPELVRVVAGTADHGKDFVQRRADPMVEQVITFLDAQVSGR
jgi:pimeloyl-ACP methyl ester carboxylesterase